MKLVGKEQVNDRTRRLYDVPKTPLRRLMDAGAVDLNKLADLTAIYADVSPLTVKRRIDRALAAMPMTLGGRRSA